MQKVSVLASEDGSAFLSGFLRWFSLQFGIQDLPQECEIEKACKGTSGLLEGHRIISGLETLAQTVLLIMSRDVLTNRCGPCFLPFESDNQGTVGIVNKMFSSKWPMAYLVMNFHHWSTQCNFHAEATHVKGVDNDYADELSRVAYITDLLAKGWKADKHFHFNLQDVPKPHRGKLYPPGAEARAPPLLRKSTSRPEEQII